MMGLESFPDNLVQQESPPREPHIDQVRGPVIWVGAAGAGLSLIPNRFIVWLTAEHRKDFGPGKADVGFWLPVPGQLVIGM